MNSLPPDREDESDQGEYVAVTGSLTAEKVALFENRFDRERPAIRYRRVQASRGRSGEDLFSLHVHREDRRRASPAILEITEVLWPTLPYLVAKERDLAALVRQYMRAADADDRLAANRMLALLDRHLELLFGALLGPVVVEGSIHVWFDGIGAQQVTLVPPCGLEILGYIYCDEAQVRQPLTAELRASPHHELLEGFVARFGDREHLAATKVINTDAAEYRLGAFRVSIGKAVPNLAGQPVNWAFEFAKVADRP